MPDVNQIKEIVAKELGNQRFGVYSTVRNDRPHSTLVGYALTEDLTKIIFYTPINTRKFVNTRLHHHAVLFIDNTKNQPEDTKKAVSIAAKGQGRIGSDLPHEEYESYKKIYLDRNPHMEFFIRPKTEMIVLDVQEYEVVSNFQTVVDWSTESVVLKVRQIQGDRLVEAVNRGRALVLPNDSKTDVEWEDLILVTKEMTNEPEIDPSRVKGLIIEGPDTNGVGKRYAEKLGIPAVCNIEDATQYISTNDPVTVDGYLGYLILHNLK